MEDLLDPHKFSREADTFLKVLGTQWIPESEYETDNAQPSNALVFYNGNNANYVDFLDRGLQECHVNTDYIDKVQMIGGISNDQSEAYEVDFRFWESPAVANGVGGLVSFGQEIDIHMVYSELVGIQAKEGRSAA
eukprot:gene14453-15121_t